jgi:transcriptional regulator with XRE-family HTH domain
MNIHKQIGLNVRRLRLKRDISQQTLAFEAGVALNYVSGIECGKKNPTVKILAQLAGVLKVTAADLFAPVSETALPRKQRGRNIHHQGRKLGVKRRKKA